MGNQTAGFEQIIGSQTSGFVQTVGGDSPCTGIPMVAGSFTGGDPYAGILSNTYTVYGVYSPRWKFCPDCGTSLACDWKFCAGCAKPIPVAGMAYNSPYIEPYPNWGVLNSPNTSASFAGLEALGLGLA